MTNTQEFQRQAPAPPPILYDVHQNELFRKDVANALPSFSIESNRFLQIVYNVLLKNQNLMACQVDSLRAAIMTIAHLGLNPEPSIGQIYIVPRKGQATIVIGYRGLITLARRTDTLTSVQTRVVYKGDVFDLGYGTTQTLVHKPCLDYQKRGREISLAYSHLILKGGVSSIDHMLLPDIENIRKRSAAKNNGPWVTDYEAMCCKTVLKRHLKFESLGLDDMIGTASALGGAEIDRDFDSDAGNSAKITNCVNLDNMKKGI